MKDHYKTIVISDVHLGTEGSKAKELVKFLKVNTCDRLILNGDIIDGWQLKKYGKWKKPHSRFFKRVIQMIDTHNTEVVYLRGNHDDFLDHIIPFRIGNISIQRDYIHNSCGKSYYIVHGDVFDSVTTNLKWVAKLGDVGYTFLLWMNQRYNNYRLKRGLPYYSLSQVVKAKVKSAVSYIDDFEKQLVCLANIRKCDGIICGHIHHPALKKIGNVEYMNSGDWVETLSALVETHEGVWGIVYYNETLIEEEVMDEEEHEDGNSLEDDIISLREALFKQKSAS
jgi:UDP-2,3-diacylglucosamine pyrophosphatase LpxH